MDSSSDKPRPLDHLVLPTADLDVARARLTALGFTVAPVGVHPFGTANCCVHFADGAFLEPLAVADRAAADTAIAAGNVFVARDRAYRARNGEEGLSASVLATENAEADHTCFQAEGVSAGDLLAFSRPFMTVDGAQDTASFLLAFAADPSAPDAFFFTCERVRVPKVDRQTLTRHANGALGIAQVVLSATEPSRFKAFLEIVIGGVAEADGDDGLRFQTATGPIVLFGPDRLRASFGIDARDEHGLKLQAIVFAVADPAAVNALISANGIACKRDRERIVVAPAAGQGATFAFEARNQ